MLRIDSTGAISGGRGTIPVWYWPLSNAVPIAVSTTIQGTDGGFILGSLVHVLCLPDTIGVGIYVWPPPPESSVPTPFGPCANAVSRLYTADMFWVANDGNNGWGFVYNGPLSVAGSIPVAVQEDGSYILQRVATGVATVYWANGTTTELPTNLQDEWSLKDSLVFMTDSAGLCLYDKTGRVNIQSLSGATTAVRAIRMFDKPWVWYRHEKDDEYPQETGRAVIHPYNDASRGWVINGDVYGGDVRVLSGGIMFAWSTEADELQGTVFRYSISNPCNLTSRNLTEIASVVGVPSAPAQSGRW